MTNLERSRYDAYIGQRQTFWTYLTNYQKAFEILINDIELSNRNSEYICYPTLFIARHTMELGFKTNIRYFMKYSGKSDYAKAGTHNLSDLFEGFKLHITLTIKNLDEIHGVTVEQSDIKEFNNFCKEVEKLTSIFHLLDKNSDSFRYPVTKENKPSFNNEEKINLLDVKAIYDQCMILFIHTSDVFSKYTDYVDEMERLYDEQMNEYYSY